MDGWMDGGREAGRQRMWKGGREGGIGRERREVESNLDRSKPIDRGEDGRLSCAWPGAQERQQGACSRVRVRCLIGMRVGAWQRPLPAGHGAQSDDDEAPVMMCACMLGWVGGWVGGIGHVIVGRCALVCVRAGIRAYAHNRVSKGDQRGRVDARA